MPSSTLIRPVTVITMARASLPKPRLSHSAKDPAWPAPEISAEPPSWRKEIKVEKTAERRVLLPSSAAETEMTVSPVSSAVLELVSINATQPLSQALPAQPLPDVPGQMVTREAVRIASERAWTSCSMRLPDWLRMRLFSMKSPIAGIPIIAITATMAMVIISSIRVKPPARAAMCG